MSASEAKKFLDRLPGDPQKNYITADRMKSLVDHIYADLPSGAGGITADDVAAQITTALEGLPAGGVTQEQVTQSITDALVDVVTADDLDAAVSEALADVVAAAVAGLQFSDASPVTVTSPLVTTQSGGEVIGLDQNGIYTQPDVVGAIPVVVDGAEYLIPLIEK